MTGIKTGGIVPSGPLGRKWVGLRAVTTRLLDWIGVRPRLLIALTGGVLLAAYLTATIAFPKANGQIVVGDAKHHFVQLRSLVFDRDLDFRNEYTGSYGIRGDEPDADWISTNLTTTGHIYNYTSVGPAILWAPLYLVATGALAMFAWVGFTGPPTGFDVVLQLVPGVTGVLAATVATWLSYRLALRWSSPASAAGGAFGVWLGSHALYYSLVSPAYSHAASMLTAAVFFSYWLGARDRPSVGGFATLGALAGACALMRWQDALFAIVPAVELLMWRATWRQRAAAAAAAAAAWALVFSPQMAVWHVLYGRAFTVPQGPAFLQWTAPHPIAVLFSDNHGLFTWAPLLIVATIGFVMCCQRHRTMAPLLALVMLLSWYLNAAVADWWAGEAFGARRFLSLFPLFVLGLATWLERAGTAAVRGRRVLIIAALLGANWLLLLQYQLFMKGLTAIAPYPSGWYDMWVVRFLIPFRLLASWLA
jgi:hypothetical protein